MMEMNEMVERVAREIYRSMMRDMSEAPTLTPMYLNAARVAIEAMREPTQEMISAAMDPHEGLGGSTVTIVWQEMIDAALSPSNQTETMEGKGL
jgi:hypothetical protein